MSDLLTMHGYGAYVWSAYAVFFVTLALDVLAPMQRRRRLLAGLRARLARESARKTSSRAP